MKIKISIERTEPLVGTAAAGRRAPVPFVGWLDLLRAISELVGADGSQSDQNPEVKHDVAETVRGNQDLA
jgi:hypothetical protein